MTCRDDHMSTTNSANTWADMTTRCPLCDAAEISTSFIMHKSVVAIGHFAGFIRQPRWPQTATWSTINSLGCVNLQKAHMATRRRELFHRRRQQAGPSRNRARFSNTNLTISIHSNLKSLIDCKCCSALLGHLQNHFMRCRYPKHYLRSHVDKYQS